MWKDEPVTTSQPVQAPKHTPRLIAVWLFGAAMSVLVIFLTPEDARIEWFVMVIGASTLLTFALQLGTALRTGFITRIAMSVAGVVLIVGLAFGVNALLP